MRGASLRRQPAEAAGFGGRPNGAPISKRLPARVASCGGPQYGALILRRPSAKVARSGGRLRGKPISRPIWQPVWQPIWLPVSEDARGGCQFQGLPATPANISRPREQVTECVGGCAWERTEAPRKFPHNLRDSLLGPPAQVAPGVAGKSRRSSSREKKGAGRAPQGLGGLPPHSDSSSLRGGQLRWLPDLRCGYARQSLTFR